jgi:hypothetical protein
VDRWRARKGRMDLGRWTVLSCRGLADATADDRRLPGGQRSAGRTGLRLVTSKFTSTALGCGLDFQRGQNVYEFRAGDFGRGSVFRAQDHAAKRAANLLIVL